MKDEQLNDPTRLLKWIREYPGWWYLICTPGEEHMDLTMMQTLLQRLSQEGFYEIVFVLLMVHRDQPFMKHFFAFKWLDSLIDHWTEEQKRILQSMISYFE